MTDGQQDRIGLWRAVDLLVPSIVFAIALSVHSSFVSAIAVLALLISLWRLYGHTMPFLVLSGWSEHYQFGLGKLLQCGGLMLSIVAILVGTWFVVSGSLMLATNLSLSTALNDAIATTAHGLLVVWYGLRVFHPVAGDRSYRVKRTNLLRFLVLLLAQLVLTISATSQDPILAHFVNTVGTTVVGAVLVIAGFRETWACISDLIDHPMGQEMESRITGVLVGEELQREAMVDMRLRRCARQVFAEITLRPTGDASMRDLSQSLSRYHAALERTFAPIDIAFKLQGSAVK